MTPEERFVKIENSLNTVAEHLAHQAQMVEQIAAHQGRHEKAIQELTEMHKGVVIIVGRIAEAQQVTDLKLNTFTEKMNTWTETMNTLTETLNAHAEQQRVTEDKLHALIDTVDRIIRSQGGDR